MNGEIKIESEYRKGTKFSMYVIIEVENEKYKPVVDSPNKKESGEFSPFYQSK